MKRKLFLLTVGLGMALLASSCISPERKKIMAATMMLNDVEISLNLWGKITVSDFEFVPNKGQFKITFDEDTTNYVQAARNNISGDARSVLESSLYLGLALQGQFTPPISAGSPASTTNSPSQMELPNQAQAAMSNFSPGLTLNGLAPSIDERQAVEKGINDRIAEQLLKYMANPDIGTNRQAVVFGVAQVTCEPGQFTRRNYVAELDVALKYTREGFPLPLYTTTAKYTNLATTIGLDAQSHTLLRVRKETISNLTDKAAMDTGRTIYSTGETNLTIQVSKQKQPGVLAVLPLMDSRNMALRNSTRSQVELASALSLAFAAKGITAAAKSLADYVKKHESDIDTRNSLPVATTYADGRNFGFQLHPSLQAIENPSKAGSAGDVLQPVTFPLVVALLVDKADVVGNNPECPGSPWNLVVTHIQTCWIPIKKPSPWTFPWTFVLGKNYPLVERIKRAAELDQASGILEELAPNGGEYPLSIPLEYKNQYRQVQIALDLLKTSALSYEIGRTLPPASELFPSPTTETNKPGITDVFPHIVWRDTNTTFIILVRGVTNTADITGLTIAGVECQPTNIYAFTSSVNTNEVINGKTTNTTYYVTNSVAINATLPPIFFATTNSTNNVEFVVLAKETAPFSKVVAVSLQGRLPPEAAATINRDPTGRFAGVSVKPGQNLSEQQLLDTLKNVLEKSEPPAKATTIVH